MSRRRAVAAPLLVVAVAFAALWAGAPAAIAADAGAVIVTIIDRLEPAAIDVAPGTVVVWRNDDSGRHRVRAREAPARFDSGNLEPGDTFSIALADEGVYAYVDERNEGGPRYAGRITVSSSAGGQAPPPTATPDTPTPDVPPPPASTEGPSTRAVDVAILDRPSRRRRCPWQQVAPSRGRTRATETTRSASAMTCRAATSSLRAARSARPSRRRDPSPISARYIRR